MLVGSLSKIPGKQICTAQMEAEKKQFDAYHRTSQQGVE
jgi:hypothetical protein